MQNIINCGIYFANLPLTKIASETRCKNLNCNYQYCLGCKLEPVIIWTQSPDKKSLVIPIIRTSIEKHEQNLRLLNDNLAIIKLKKSNNNSILSFGEEDISYVDLNRINWIKNFRISDQYLINDELRILNETEIYDLSFRVKTLPITNINTITNLAINKNLNNKIVNYSDTALKE